MKLIWVPLLFCLSSAAAPPVVRHTLVPVPGMTRAELAVTVRPHHPVATLILAPGSNGDGASMATDANWVRFAKENGLMLVGLSFASEITALHGETGYYYAGKGSGKLLLDALDRLTKKPLPVLLYGFSGGAHFTARFVEWKPERVAAWCAYSAGWWDAPAPSTPHPFGIIACGESDGRLGASLFYFKAGRAIGRPWLWVGVPGNAHVEDTRVAAFAREAFGTVLAGMRTSVHSPSGGWVDIEDKIIASADLPTLQPTLTGWLPDMALFLQWKALTVETADERE